MARRSGLGRGLGAADPRRHRRTMGGLGLPGAARLGASTPTPASPGAHFDEEAMAALTASVRELGVLQPVLVRAAGEGTYELIAGERRWRAAKRAGLPLDPGHHPHRRRHLVARAGPGREPPAGGPQPPRRGRRLPAAPGGLPPHPRRAGRPGGQEPGRHLEHPPAVPAPPVGPATGGRGPAHRRPRPGPAHLPRPGLPGGAGPADASTEGLSVRAVEEEARRQNQRSARHPGPGRPRAGGCVRPGLLELEETPVRPPRHPGVKVEMGANKGKVVIEFATSRTWSGSTGP